MELGVLVRDHAAKIVSAIEATTPQLTSAPEQMSRHFAAAGLLRCCVIVRGILVLEDANLASLGYILARQHWETWLLSFHTLMRGHEAMKQIGADDVYWKKKLSKSLDLGINYQPDWSGGEQKLNYSDLAKALPELLQKAGERDAQTNMLPYSLHYSVPSLFAVHANLATIGAHIVYDHEKWSLDSNPSGAISDAATAPILHTAHLARYVFKEFGITDDQGVEQMGDAILEAVQMSPKTMK